MPKPVWQKDCIAKIVVIFLSPTPLHCEQLVVLHFLIAGNAGNSKNRITSKAAGIQAAPWKPVLIKTSYIFFSDYPAFIFTDLPGKLKMRGIRLQVPYKSSFLLRDRQCVNSAG